MFDGLGADWTIPEAADLDRAYVLAEVPRFPEPAFSQLMHATFFETTAAISWRGLLGEEAMRRHEERRKAWGHGFSLRLGVWFEGDLVAWTYAWQDDYLRLYQGTSGVIPAHRRKGLYRALLIRLLRRATDEGFEEVHSKHLATNNNILVAKLKAGFFLTGTELNPSFGSLVTTSCPLVPERREALLVRTGMKRPSGGLKDYLG
jgi:GNAT superfamily N-acetyltransferase